MAENIGIAVRGTRVVVRALPTVSRIVRHGELRLLVTVPVGGRCLIGFPIRTASSRYQFLDVGCDSLVDFELGLRSLHSVVATGRPVGALDIDLAATPASAMRRPSRMQLDATRLRRRLMNAFAHWLAARVATSQRLQAARPASPP